MTGQIRQGAVVVVIARSGQNGEVRNMHGVCLEYGRGLVTGAGGLAGWLAGWVLQCGVQQPLPPLEALGAPRAFIRTPLNPSRLRQQLACRHFRPPGWAGRWGRKSPLMGGQHARREGAARHSRNRPGCGPVCEPVTSHQSPLAVCWTRLEKVLEQQQLRPCLSSHLA